MPGGIALGPYDHLVTRELIQDGDVASMLTRHLAVEIRWMIDAIPSSARDDVALALANQLIGTLPSLAPGHAIDAVPFVDQQLDPPPRRLVSVHHGAPLPRPLSPLGTSDLFTGGGGREPPLGLALSREIAWADRYAVLAQG